MKQSNRPKHVDSLPHSHPERVCIFGANGQLASKLTAWCFSGAAKGVTFFAADIVPQSKFSPAFTGFADYFNLASGPDREKLFDRGRKEPFDLLYDATWPNAHLLNIVNQEAFFRHILVTKPFVAIEQISGLDALMNLAAFESVRKKFLMADHFGNKPGLTALRAKLAAAHELYGKYSRISILITERRSVNDIEEVRRQEALIGGMVPDLVSHGVLIVQLMTPKGLRWHDGHGNGFRRLDRTIRPTTCVRAQMKLAALPENVDTACLVEYHVTETLTLTREDGSSLGRPFTNSFYVLIICGKGLSATPDAGHDLKAVEISFQGQRRAPGIIDLETNTINEVLERIPGLIPPCEAERAHRGINRPVMALTEQWDDFRADEKYRTSLFQDRDLIWENMKVLSDTIAVSRPGILPSYAPREEIHHFGNTHIGQANGFQYFGTVHGSGWPMKEPPLHLMRGQPVHTPIP